MLVLTSSGKNLNEVISALNKVDPLWDIHRKCKTKM